MNISIFSNPGNGGDREDWSLCLKSLAIGFEESGHIVTFLLDGNELTKVYNEFRNIELSEIEKSKICFKKDRKKMAVITCRIFTMIFTGRLHIFRRPSHFLRFFNMTYNMLFWLENNRINAVLAINYWTDYAFIVAACDILNIPAIAIQHGNYYVDGRPLPDGPISGKSHEWPSTDVFVFSKESKIFYQKSYGSGNIHVTGWFPGIRYINKHPTRSKNVTVFESRIFPFMNQFWLKLNDILGDHKVTFRKHPLLDSLNISRFVPEEDCEPAGLTTKLPKIGISIDSSVSFELIKHQIPVIELKKDVFSENKSWVFCFSEWESAIRYIADLMEYEEKLTKLILEQQKSIPSFLKESPHLVRDNIIKTTIELSLRRSSN